VTERPEEQDRVIIRDNRKIDPVTGEARKAPSAPAGAPEEHLPAAEPAEGPMVEAALLDERTRDLQRVQAEYANYRKRADRERATAEQLGVARLLSALLPVADDLDRAREHGDYSGPLKAIGDKLESTLTAAGLEAFGAEGEPFDPSVHEAVMHDESDAVAVPTATKILRKGYRHGERLLRAAMVGVTDPATSTPSAEPQETAPTDNGATNGEPQEHVSEAPTADPTQGS
jgi:molecular chaperone GrpE